MKNETAQNTPLTTKNGYYYGTTLGRSWWRRYTHDGLLARGTADIIVDRTGVRFRRYLESEERLVPLYGITEVSIGKFHAGKWTGAPIIKVVWIKGGEELVSGFTVSWKKDVTEQWVNALNGFRNKK